jgi:hypothetical protein
MALNCHLARSAMKYLLYYTQYMQICQTTYFCYCISKTKHEFGQNPEENIILIGPGKYNIFRYLWKTFLTCMHVWEIKLLTTSCQYVFFWSNTDLRKVGRYQSDIYSEAVNRRTENTMVKRTDNDRQNTNNTQENNDWATR